MLLLSLTLQSLANRWLTAALTIAAIAVSIALLLGVEKVRTGAKVSFANTISGTDLIVGARSGPVQLLLYSVFRIGNATANISWSSYEAIAADQNVAWTVPLSLGDSHRGFRVLGTTTEYFARYRYRGGQNLQFETGKPFDDLFDAVIGADVAENLGYRLGDDMVVAHGIGAAGFSKHEDKPFRVAGILEKTGTPVDRTVHVSLEGIEAIHIGWETGAPTGPSVTADEARKLELKPKAVTAALVGLKSKFATFRLQRAINEYRGEPLLAIIPGVALHELWGLIGLAETALGAVSVMVVVTAILGMITTIFAGLNERRREMAILRALGAPPRTILGLLLIESTVLSIGGAMIGAVLLYAGLFALRPAIDALYGLYLPVDLPTVREWWMLGAVACAGAFAGLPPALRAYRLSLADGMAIRH